MERITFTHSGTIDEIVSASNVFMHLSGHDLFRDQLRVAAKEGAYACRATPEGVPTLILPLGLIVPDKLERYLTLVQEKIRRNAAHPDHLSSRDSANPELDLWPGAVRTRGGFRSLSGLTADLDEMFSVFWALDLNDMEGPAAQAILAKNETFMSRYRFSPYGLMK